MKLSTSQIAQTALLAALTLVLSYLETLIPLPVTVPGLKLGLANITVLYALYMIDTPTAIFLMLVKVIISSLLFGSPMMIIFSFCGSALAFLGMFLLKRSDKVAVVTVSIVAAVLHNIGQLLAATVVLATPLVLLNAPVLMIAAVVTGSLTGAVAVAVMHAVGPRNGRSRRGVLLGADAEAAAQGLPADKPASADEPTSVEKETSADKHAEP